jgi:hypothetical protein
MLSNRMPLRVSGSGRVYRVASALPSTGVDTEGQTRKSTHLECIDNHGA